MNGVNKVILLGRIGDEPKCSYTQGGMCITKISLATTSSRKNKDGERTEETSWHRVTFFGKVAEIAGEYLRKGSQVYVEGALRYGKYEKDGVTHYTTDILADQMQMLGSRGEGGGTQRPTGGYGQQEPRGGRNADKPASQGAPPMDDFADDDLDF